MDETNNDHAKSYSLCIKLSGYVYQFLLLEAMLKSSTGMVTVSSIEFEK